MNKQSYPLKLPASIKSAAQRLAQRVAVDARAEVRQRLAHGERADAAGVLDDLEAAEDVAARVAQRLAAAGERFVVK